MRNLPLDETQDDGYDETPPLAEDNGWQLNDEDEESDTNFRISKKVHSQLLHEFSVASQALQEASVENFELRKSIAMLQGENRDFDNRLKRVLQDFDLTRARNVELEEQLARALNDLQRKGTSPGPGI